MIPIKVNGKKVNLPTTWEDVKFKDFMTHLECKDGYDVIANFIGIPHNELRKTKEVENFHIANNALQFIIDEPLPPIKNNFAINVNGKVLLFPVDIGSQVMYGQYEDMLQVANEFKEGDNNKSFFLISEKICKMFLQPYITNKEYDYYTIDSASEFVNNLKAWQVYSISSFFLKDWQRLQNGTGRTLRKLDLVKGKFWQGLRAWKSLGYSIYCLPYVMRLMRGQTQSY